jgi:hypothetical protein
VCVDEDFIIIMLAGRAGRVNVDAREGALLASLLLL